MLITKHIEVHCCNIDDVWNVFLEAVMAEECLSLYFFLHITSVLSVLGTPLNLHSEPKIEKQKNRAKQNSRLDMTKEQKQFSMNRNSFIFNPPRPSKRLLNDSHSGIVSAIKGRNTRGHTSATPTAAVLPGCETEAACLHLRNAVPQTLLSGSHIWASLPSHFNINILVTQSTF